MDCWGRQDSGRRPGWRGHGSGQRFTRTLPAGPIPLSPHGPGQAASDDVCDVAVSSFDQYQSELRSRCSELARQRTSDQRRQRAVVNALVRKALQWEKP